MKNPGIGCALGAAALFGASTPFAKLLLGEGIAPVFLAGLLYLGSGCGLAVWWLALRRRRDSEARLTRKDVPWLAGAIASGGVAAPVLLMLGLNATPASTASLLLNLEGVFTALLAWFVFRENFDRRIALGMLAIAAGGVVLSWVGRPEPGVPWGPTVNTGIAVAFGARLPDLPTALGAAGVGFVGYGVSLVCFVLALRHLGTARTGAYFSTAPFVGAAVSLALFGESVTWPLLVAAGLMTAGVWLHLTERHAHEHLHEEMNHDHPHVHDEHHQHEHHQDDPSGEPHSHPHRHEAQRHSHAHYPDIHHRHDH